MHVPRRKKTFDEIDDTSPSVEQGARPRRLRSYIEVVCPSSDKQNLRS